MPTTTASRSAALAQSLWVDEEGRWPLPWLQPLWERARSLQGHAVLMQGPSRVGQFELALTLAQGWLCEGQGRQPCGRCAGCHLLRSGVHPDLRVLVPDSLRDELGLSAASEDEGGGAEGEGAAKGKSAGRDIRVQDVRAAIDWSRQTASRGGLKVLVLHPAHRMNAISANALLKTLEEPPPSVKIILSGDDPHALLPTLRSRCQHLTLDHPPKELALSWLRELGIEAADVLLRAAGGRPQDAARMAAEGWDAERWADLPRALAAGRVEAFAGLTTPRLLDVLQKICLDASSRRWGTSADYFPGGSIPPGADVRKLSAWWKRLIQTARHEDHPWNAPLLLESLVQEGRQCWPVAKSLHR